MKTFIPIFLVMLFTLVVCLVVSLSAFACTTCNLPLQAAIFDASFLKLILYMLLPFLLIWAVVFRLHKLK